MMLPTAGLRVVPFNEKCLNDTEQDANSVLTELDKGLRSAKHGLQCEAIVRFPRLFEKYPFPILINSSFLKLAEFFWNGSNLLRFWVLRVCQQSEKHLDKILNIDAFVKRIFMVIHSNDPVARALTLRVLGAVSRVIPEKQQVHHAIRRALDSHDTVEVEAAIFASGQFAAQSRSFAISMCAKISDMIESLQIPVPMKLQLIPVLRYMHHDAKTASLVKELCCNLLPKYPAQSFVLAILDSLTELSARTLTAIGDQINLLLEFLADERKPVRCQVLHSLIALTTDQCVHAWPKTAMPVLIEKATACTDSSEQYMFLTLLLKLSDSPLTCHMLLLDEAAVVDLCLSCICLDDYNTASQALAILAALAAYADYDQVKVEDIMVVVNLHIEGLVFCTVGEVEYTRYLGKILACGVRIASVSRDFRHDFTTMIASLLTDDVEYPPANAQLLCNTLGALCALFQLEKFAETKPLQSPVAMETDDFDANRSPPKITSMLEHLPLLLCKVNAIMDAGSKPDQLHTLEILIAVVLQCLIGCFVPKKVIDCVERSCKGTNCWTPYRIARSASRYGQHYVAAHIFTKLSRNPIVDRFHFFLMGLAQMEQAECILNYCVEYEFMRLHYEQCQPNLLATGKRIPPAATKPTAKSAAAAVAGKVLSVSATTVTDAVPAVVTIAEGVSTAAAASPVAAVDKTDVVAAESSTSAAVTVEDITDDVVVIEDSTSDLRVAGTDRCTPPSATNERIIVPAVSAEPGTVEGVASPAANTDPINAPATTAVAADTKTSAAAAERIGTPPLCEPVQAIPLVSRLELATNLYWQALASMRASSSPANPLTFQLEYIKLRAQFLQALHMALTVKNGQVIVPPPAIASSLAQNSRDYLQKFGHVTNQLRKLVKAIRSCEESYSRLFRSAFDADPATLEFLELAEYQCALFGHLVETICFATPSEPPAYFVAGKHPETRYFAACCRRMEQLRGNLPEEPTNAKTISNRHLEVVVSVIDLMTKTPICLPRYFFQIQQSTQIKLSVSPQPRGTGEPVIVQFGSNLVIKVEGVIQHYGRKRSPLRSVDAVQLSLTAQLMTPRSNSNEPVKAQQIDNVTLTQTVKPQRDFISGSFLLPISSGGQWQVTLETSVVDENGMTWCTGPKNSMVVLVLMDDTQKVSSSSSRRF